MVSLAKGDEVNEASDGKGHSKEGNEEHSARLLRPQQPRAPVRVVVANRRDDKAEGGEGHSHNRELEEGGAQWRRSI